MEKGKNSMELYAVFIALMLLVLAFTFVDITGGKKTSPRTFQIYGAVFALAGFAALISYFLEL